MTVHVQHRTELLASGAVVHIWSPPRPPSGLVQLQHGFGEYAERYVDDHHRLVPLLVARGYEVWAVDLLGHGRSPGPRLETDLAQSVEDHVAVRRSLRGRGLPIVAFGHSLGGLVSAASVARDPTGVQSVILSSPILLRRTPRSLRLLARGPAGIAAGTDLRGRSARLTHDPAVTARAAADEMISQGPPSTETANSALDVADQLWRSIRLWSTPTTIIHGSDDDVAFYDRSAAFVRAVDLSSVVLTTVEGGFHELLHDKTGDITTLLYVLGLFKAAFENNRQR